MNEIKVSVIVYVKNTIDYIEKCIRSVMDQTLSEIEILVIDGGSTDGTLRVIEKLQQSDSRIRIFHSDASVGAQFNLGLREARGQYIGICEADDYILPEMYERQYRIADENRLDVIRAGYYQIFNINDKEYRFKLKPCYQERITEKVIISDKSNFFLEQGINGFWNGLYRKQFLLDNHIWMNETKGAAYQDISFSFLTQMYAERIWFMSETFYCYRIDNPNASVNSLHGVELHINEYEELKKRLKISGRWDEYKNMFFSWELVSYRWFLGELPRDLKADNADKIYYHIKSQMEDEKYDENYVMETVRSLAKALSDSRSEFTEFILSETENEKKLLEYVEGSLKYDKMIILFGAGHIGNILLEFFRLCNKKVLLMDNSVLLQQNGLKGDKVYKPERLASCYPNGRYIIANISHAQEMRKQLLELGIQSRDILICDDEEFFLRKIFVKAGQYSGQ
ncbi:glycosyltransferase family 2 protein [Lachnospiraceae bacterium 62-26]|jgi:Glycosyltransferases involved in cell wall biogenesis